MHLQHSLPLFPPPSTSPSPEVCAQVGVVVVQQHYYNQREEDATFVKLIRLPSEGFHLFTPFTHYLSTVFLCLRTDTFFVPPSPLHPFVKLLCCSPSAWLALASVWFINQVKTLSRKSLQRKHFAHHHHHRVPSRIYFCSVSVPHIFGYSPRKQLIFFVFSFSGFMFFFLVFLVFVFLCFLSVLFAHLA